MKRIAHVGAWNRNYGDWALCWGLHKRLRDESGEPLVFDLIDVQATFFHQSLIELINDRYDMLLVGGGGLIMDRAGAAEIDTISGWQWAIEEHELSRITIPLVVYAIGYNQFPFNARPLAPSTWRHIKATAERADLFSVRDEGSWKAVGCIDAEIVPDPALWIEPEPFDLPDWRNGKVNVGLNWAGDRPKMRFASDGEQFDLHEHVLHLRKGHSVHLTPHIDGVDATRDTYAGMMPPNYVQVPILAGLYQAMDVAIGMRGHANIIAAAVGTPPISIGHHAKNRWFMESIGLKDNHIDLDSDVYEIIAQAMERGVKKPEPNRDFDRRVISLLNAKEGDMQTIAQTSPRRAWA